MGESRHHLTQKSKQLEDTGRHPSNEWDDGSHDRSREGTQALLRTQNEETRSATTSGASPDHVIAMQCQIQNLCRALKEKEVEAKGLKQALRYYQKDTKKKKSLYPDLESQLLTTRDELMAARLQVEQGADVAMGLRYEISERDQELEHYKKENERLRRTIVGLEIDLDTHEIHMTDYAERQIQLEEVALEESFGGTKTMEVLEIEERYGSRIQDLISKQIMDYCTLEIRYKRDRAESSKKISDLQAAIGNLEASVVVLESRIAGEKSVKFSLKRNSNIYRERINVLERTNAKLIATNGQLLERLASLESRLSQPSRWTQELVRYTNNTSNDFDERLRESQRKITFLMKAIEFKDKRIALLRAEAITYQLRNLPPTQYAVDLSDDETTHEGIDQGQKNEESKEYYNECKSANHLQEQLQALQETLLRKDREIAEQQRLSQAREEVLSVQLDAARNIGDMKEFVNAQFFL